MSDIKIDVLSDSSGAPPVVNVDGWLFAFDILGKIHCSCINGGSSRIGRSVLAIAKSRYKAALLQAVDSAWLQKNKEMYSEGTK